MPNERYRLQYRRNVPIYNREVLESVQKQLEENREEITVPCFDGIEYTYPFELPNLANDIVGSRGAPHILSLGDTELTEHSQSI